MKLQAFDSIYFLGKSHFEDDGMQNCLVLHAVHRCFKKIGNSVHISTRKSKGLSDESIKPPIISDISLAPSINYIGA